MRTLFSALAALLALVVAAGGLACAWLDQNLVEESGFVALAGPLVEDQAFQSALADSLAEEVTASAGLPDQLDALVEPLIRNAAGAVSGSSGYPAAWAETLRLSHAFTFAQAPDPSEAAPAVLTFDLAPVIGLLTESVDGSLGFEVPLPEDTTIDIGTVERGGLLSRLSDVVRSWPLYLTGAGVLALLALVIARRRGTTLALLGLGLALIGGIGALAGTWLPGMAAGIPGTGALADVFVQGLAGRAAADLAASSTPVVVGGLLALVIGVLLQIALGRRRRA